MTRWDWTWEERTKAGEQDDATRPEPQPVGRAGGSAAQRRRFRRRRSLAIIAAVVVVVALTAVLDSHGGDHDARVAVSHPAHSGRPLTGVESRALRARAENDAIDRVLSYTPAVVEGGDKGNELALTFDDGPGPYTQRLVAVLNSLHVKATFFAIGEEERYFSAGTLMELRSGDIVGDHTETHPMMALLSEHEQHEELFEQIARIELLGGPRPRLFRPPYGSFDATTLRELHSLHLLMVLWSTDTEDYTLPGVQAIVHRALAGAHPGAIILMHDAGGDRSQTIAALPQIINGLRKRGLHPVTVPQLLLDDPPPPGQPIPKSLAGG
jgi:peptidoglycan/xylan/chitin deacetylase (PgdA/CDA1 family)